MSAVNSELLEKVFSIIITESEQTRGILAKIKVVLLSFAEKHSMVKVLTVLAQVVAREGAKNSEFYGELVEIIGDIITYEEQMEEIRCKLAEQITEESKYIFSVLYPAM
jgi:ubiquinone/menaquinone biosynthesis C-methylase UbiE